MVTSGYAFLPRYVQFTITINGLPPVSITMHNLPYNVHFLPHGSCTMYIFIITMYFLPHGSLSRVEPRQDFVDFDQTAFCYIAFVKYIVVCSSNCLCNGAAMDSNILIVKALLY